jgi:uncharacterized protein (DUF849 family)
LGRESLAPESVAAAPKAIPRASPGLAVGISTAAYIEPGLSRRLALIEAWTVLPDNASVNLCEPGIEELLHLLMRRGVGLEAVIWTPEDARHLLTLSGVPWLRLLLEPRGKRPRPGQPDG